MSYVISYHINPLNFSLPPPGDPPHAGAELRRQHHPSADVTEGEARAGRDALGRQRGVRRTHRHEAARHLGAPRRQAAGLQDGRGGERQACDKAAID